MTAEEEGPEMVYLAISFLTEAHKRLSHLIHVCGQRKEGKVLASIYRAVPVHVGSLF